MKRVKKTKKPAAETVAAQPTAAQPTAAEALAQLEADIRRRERLRATAANLVRNTQEDLTHAGHARRYAGHIARRQESVDIQVRGHGVWIDSVQVCGRDTAALARDLASVLEQHAERLEEDAAKGEAGVAEMIAEMMGLPTGPESTARDLPAA